MKRPRIDAALNTLKRRRFTSIDRHEVVEHSHMFAADCGKDSVTERHWYRTTMGAEDLPFCCVQHSEAERKHNTQGYRGAPCSVARALTELTTERPQVDAHLDACQLLMTDDLRKPEACASSPVSASL